MELAYVTCLGRGMVDELISKLAAALEADGLGLAGTVCARPADPNAHSCDIDLRVLPNSPHFRINRAIGSGAKGCRLAVGVERQQGPRGSHCSNSFGCQVLEEAAG